MFWPALNLVSNVMNWNDCKQTLEQELNRGSCVSFTQTVALLVSISDLAMFVQ